MAPSPPTMAPSPSGLSASSSARRLPVSPATWRERRGEFWIQRWAAVPAFTHTACEASGRPAPPAQAPPHLSGHPLPPCFHRSQRDVLAAGRGAAGGGVLPTPHARTPKACMQHASPSMHAPRRPPAPPPPDLCRADRDRVLHLEQLRRQPAPPILRICNVAHAPPHHAKCLRCRGVPLCRFKCGCAWVAAGCAGPRPAAACCTQRMGNGQAWPPAQATPGTPCLAEGEDVDDVRRAHAAVLPPRPVHKVLVRVVQHQPRARRAAQLRRAPHLGRLHQHACVARAWGQGGGGGGGHVRIHTALVLRIAGPVAAAPGRVRGPTLRRLCASPVGLQGFVITTILGGAGPASSPASQSRSGWPVAAARGPNATCAPPPLI